MPGTATLSRSDPATLTNSRLDLSPYLAQLLNKARERGLCPEDENGRPGPVLEASISLQPPASAPRIDLPRAAPKPLNPAQRQELKARKLREWEREAGFRSRRLRRAEFDLKRYVWWCVVTCGRSYAEIRPADLSKRLGHHPNTIRAARRSLADLGVIDTLDARPGRPTRVVLGWRRLAELREIAASLEARARSGREGICEGDPYKWALEHTPNTSVTGSTRSPSVSSVLVSERDTEKIPRGSLVPPEAQRSPEVSFPVPATLGERKPKPTPSGLSLKRQAGETRRRFGAELRALVSRLIPRGVDLGMIHTHLARFELGQELMGLYRVAARDPEVENPGAWLRSVIEKRGSGLKPLTREVA